MIASMLGSVAQRPLLRLFGVGKLCEEAMSLKVAGIRAGVLGTLRSPSPGICFGPSIANTCLPTLSSIQVLHCKQHT